MKIESEQAERLLKLIADGVEQGKGFVLEQAPDVVQQLILWKRVELLVVVGIGVCLCIAAYPLVRKAKSETIRVEALDRNETFCDVASVVVWGMGVLIAGIGGPMTIGVNISPCLQVWLAPKVFLIEYLAKCL